MLWSCASSPKAQFSDVQTAKWEASALVKDFANRRSLVLNIEGLTERPDRMRVSATTSLGIHLMTMVMNDGLVSYVIPQSREYYSGPVSDHVLRPAFSIDLHPKYLNTLVFDEPPQGEGWSCSYEGELLKSCLNEGQKLEVNWLKRNRSRKTIEIRGEEFSIQLSLNKFDPEVELQANSFDLTPPENYQKYRIK